LQATAAAITAISALAGAAFLTQLMRAIARGGGVLDVPNARSSHRVPTPRGGGVAIVVVTTAALLLGTWRGVVGPDLMRALIGGGLAVALTGLADDSRSLSPVTRLAVHCAAALWALLCLGGLPPLSIAGRLIALGWAGYVLGTLGIVWALNLFNFMDGIDGIAASEAAFVALAGAALTVLAAGPPGVGFTGLALAAACGGFLLWNWPPAKIFLGDVGSGYLGYVIVVLALAAARDHPAALWTWLILGGAFFVDATVTLVRRSLRGARLHEAHRTHAYQWLAQRWGSHLRVTLAVLVVDVLWLLPCAVVSVLRPALAAVTTLVALAPLVVLAILAGSGRAAEREPS
jgi:Fuc2NAc and GlcNAc transferase